MPAQVGPEAAVRVVAEKGAPTVKNAETIRAAEAYGKKITAGDHRGVLEEAALRKEQIDERAARRNISENIGAAAPDPITGNKVRNADEQGRFDRATRAENRLLRFLHEGRGYENLNRTDQRAVRRALETEIRQWRGGPDIFTGKTPAEIDAFLEGWARDPNLYDKIKELHASRVVNPEEKVGHTTKEQGEKIDEKEKTIQTKEEEITTNQDEQRKEYETIESFEDRTGTGGTLGPNRARLNAIDAELGANYTPTMAQALKREQAEWDTEVKSLTEAIAAENRAKKPDAGELTRLRGLLNTARGELRVRNGKLEDYKSLTQEKAGLETKRDQAQQRYKQLTNDHIEKTSDFTKLQDELFILKAELGMVASDRAEAEEAFVRSIEGIYGDALSKLWTERLIVLGKALDEADSAELTNPDTDPVRAEFLRGAGMIWHRLEVKGGRFRGARIAEKKLDKDQVELCVEGIKNGTVIPKDIVTQVLRGAKKPDGTNYTNTEIADWITSHPELAKKSENDAMERLVIAGLQARKIKQEDIDAFVSAGILNEDSLFNKFENDPEVRKKLEKAGIVGKTLDFLKKNKKLGWWILFAPLLTTPAGLAAVSGYAGYRIIRPTIGKQAAAKE